MKIELQLLLFQSIILEGLSKRRPSMVSGGRWFNFVIYFINAGVKYLTDLFQLLNILGMEHFV